MSSSSFRASILVTTLLFGGGTELYAAPHQATGFKVGEVSADRALVWTRLTKNSSPNAPGSGMFEIQFKEGGSKGRTVVTGVTYPAGKSADDIDYAVPGIAGETRVRFRPAGQKAWQETAWVAVEPEWDFTRQHVLEKLTPATRYEVAVDSRSSADGTAGDPLTGSFVTAPTGDDADTPVVFTVSTGQAFRDRNSDQGYVIYDAMLKVPDLSFFVHTGDIVYYDREAKTRDLANWHWQRTYSLPTNVRFHRQVASYFIKDDHDTWTNDCWSTMKAPSMGTFTYEQGLALFPHQVPMDGDNTIRTRRWGKNLQIWLVEGRDFRSPNTDPDGPEKTIWGAEQKAWFKKSFAESDATFRILISPTPLVGPDRDNKNDNHANLGFTHEGDEIRAFLSEQKNAFVVCGDRHWQYHSIHPTSGVQEFSCGPASEKHAGGWQKSDFREDYHQFLQVQGGFLSVRSEQIDKTPTLTFRFHDEAGEIDYEKQFTPRNP